LITRVQTGIIPAAEAPAFKANAVRNRFAHQPRSYFSEEAADGIWAKLSPRMIERFVNIDFTGLTVEAIELAGICADGCPYCEQEVMGALPPAV
jgi:hypothetical protein